MQLQPLNNLLRRKRLSIQQIVEYIRKAGEWNIRNKKLNGKHSKCSRYNTKKYSGNFIH